MSKNTPGFVGERLTEARTARAISAVDLAGIIGVSPQSISKYENGHQSPKLDILYSISSALGFNQSYFLRAYLAPKDLAPIFWRGKLTAQQGMQDRASVRLLWLKDIVSYLSDYFDFPSLNVPSFPIEDIERVDLDTLEDIAKKIRVFWGIRPGPMPHVLERMESNGIFVSRIRVNAEKLDAFSQWSDQFNSPFVMLGRDKSSAVRQRFDALHELSHIVLHKNIKEHRKLNNKATYKTIEQQADRLASCLMLPEQEFMDELYAPSLDGFLALKERWGVSVAAMIMRCRALEILDADQATRMWKNYTRRGWRKSEPLDNKLEKEKPQLIRKSFELLLSEGFQTVSDIQNALPFPLTDLEELAELPAGTLGGDRHEHSISPSIKAELKKSLSGSNVIRFTKN